MNFWIQFFVVIAAVFGVLAEDPETIIPRCIKETNVTRQEIMSDRLNRSRNNPRVKCFYACYAKNRGWLTEDGDIIVDILFKSKSEVPVEKWPELDRMIDTCAKKWEDPCETAYSVQKCIENQLGIKYDQ